MCLTVSAVFLVAGCQAVPPNAKETVETVMEKGTHFPTRLKPGENERKPNQRPKSKTKTQGLLVSQRHEGIDSRCAARWNQNREQRHHRQKNGDAAKRQRIKRTEINQNRRQ